MPFLRLYSGDNLEDQWELGAEDLNIGRAADNDIVLENPGISKRHAHIEADGSHYVLVDDGSANGVFVNQQKVSRHILKFWDEIQIYPYKLVFMSGARLSGETTGHEISERSELKHLGTVVMKPGAMASRWKQLEKQRMGQIVVIASGVKILLEKINFTLGRGRYSDLRCGGWLAPRLAATIQRRQDGHYLIPAKRGRVRINGESSRDPVRLMDNSDLEIQGTALKYYYRPIDGH
ncbi:FHA domain-containing protein [uncultured Thiodictyon sp.]|uniref:FHA domain-containing protein n=1 Tax=uncultured Thiodictyon sp. TaxID=1846217 RepID=UPI0025EB67C3|nr:FHA domain-containing protein [uncultured Thiodictyon sp.]